MQNILFVLTSPAVPIQRVLPEWFVRLEVSDCTIDILEGVVSKISSKQLATSLCGSYLIFSPVFKRVQGVQPYTITNTVTTWKNSSFILLEKSDFYMVIHQSIEVHALPMRMSITFCRWDITTDVYKLVNWFHVDQISIWSLTCQWQCMPYLCACLSVSVDEI